MTFPSAVEFLDGFSWTNRALGRDEGATVSTGSFRLRPYIIQGLDEIEKIPWTGRNSPLYQA